MIAGYVFENGKGKFHIHGKVFFNRNGYNFYGRRECFANLFIVHSIYANVTLQQQPKIIHPDNIVDQ